MSNFKAMQYARDGFRYHNRVFFGVIGFALYTLGYVWYHLGRKFK